MVSWNPRTTPQWDGRGRLCERVQATIFLTPELSGAMLQLDRPHCIINKKSGPQGSGTALDLFGADHMSILCFDFHERDRRGHDGA